MTSFATHQSRAGTESDKSTIPDKSACLCSKSRAHNVGAIPQSDDELTFAGDWTEQIGRFDVSAKAVRRRARG